MSMTSLFFFDFGSGAEKAYIPYPVDTFEKGLRNCLDTGIISPETIFLDLGAGKGRIVREAARYNFYAYGIEFHEEYVAAADLAIADARRSLALKNGSLCRIVQGSYYPEKYIALRNCGKAIALQYEDRFFDQVYSNSHHAISFPSKTRAHVFYPVASKNDPFAALGITFSRCCNFF